MKKSLAYENNKEENSILINNVQRNKSLKQLKKVRCNGKNNVT